ncbi:MAG: hypothetical protein JWP69_964 [Flaviaesturariibacter sp.]|nr:hypothetical protein [Flaviaesturariibacter sp.]
MKYYKLNIHTDKTIETYNEITNLLGVQPKPVEQDSGLTYSIWTFEVEEDNEGPYYHFINRFLDIIEPRFEDLQKLGVEKSNITFWMLYEYDQQCAMEFHPQEMKRLGDSGIVLCIDCWQAS